MNEILNFIKRRFNQDCNWLNGNCYYFALILKNRFPSGEIFYDIIDGHFLFKFQNKYYDWSGLIIIQPYQILIPWNEIENYDPLVAKRIYRDCIE